MRLRAYLVNFVQPIFLLMVFAYGVFTDIFRDSSQEPYKVLLSSLGFTIALASLSLGASRTCATDSAKSQTLYKLGENFMKSALIFMMAIIIQHASIIAYGDQVALKNLSFSQVEGAGFAWWTGFILRLISFFLYLYGLLTASIAAFLLYYSLVRTTPDPPPTVRPSTGSGRTELRPVSHD